MKRKTGIIVALDVPRLSEAEELIETLAPEVDAFKIGMELCTAEGTASAVKLIHSKGGDVFLDLKYYDIPNTVAGAVRAASDLGVWMVNMHVSAGSKAMEEAIKAKSKDLKLIGVTVLTSFDDGGCRQIYGENVRTMAGNFILLAYEAGLDGVVCSPKELDMVEEITVGASLGGFITVTPGIRPKWAATGDQKRIMTPSQALAAGSDYLVIGRPITNPPNDMTPLEAVRKIKEEIDTVFHS